MSGNPDYLLCTIWGIINIVIIIQVWLCPHTNPVIFISNYYCLVRSDVFHIRPDTVNTYSKLGNLDGDFVSGCTHSNPDPSIS